MRFYIHLIFQYSSLIAPFLWLKTMEYFIVILSVKTISIVGVCFSVIYPPCTLWYLVTDIMVCLLVVSSIRFSLLPPDMAGALASRGLP